MALVADQDVSLFVTVPVLGLEYFKSHHAARCTKLRHVGFGGEPLPMDLVDLVEAAVRSRDGVATSGPQLCMMKDCAKPVNCLWHNFSPNTLNADPAAPMHL